MVRALMTTNRTRSNRHRHNGFSPAQWVLGFAQKLPWSLSESGDSLAAKETCLQEGGAFKGRLRMAADAEVAFLDADETLCFEILWTILIVLDSNERILLDWENVDLMEGRTLTAGPGKNRVEAPATPKSPGPGGGGSLLGSALPPFLGGERSKTIAEAAGTTKSSKKKTKKKR